MEAVDAVRDQKLLDHRDQKLTDYKEQNVKDHEYQSSKLSDQKMGASEASEVLGLYCSSLYRKCSNCGQTGHNSRTCLEVRSEPAGQMQMSKAESESRPEMSDTVEPMSPRKDDEEISEVSGQRTKPKEGARRKGVAWTEEEHKNFLTGLQKLGKGNWRGISRHFVQSKSPTQVASHAQKYFIRQTIAGKRKRRSSLFDLVPEDDKVKEPSTATTSIAQATTTATKSDFGNDCPAPSIEQPTPPPSSVQSPEAIAWAYWYQNMIMQQNPMAWMNPMMNAMHPSKPAGAQDPSHLQMPYAMMGAMGSMPHSFLGGQQAHKNIGGLDSSSAATSNTPNPAMAAILAHQSQMAAFMAMNYMPQVTPDYMARYAAGMQIQAAQAMQAAQAAQSAASMQAHRDSMQAHQDLSTPEISATDDQEHSMENDEQPSRFTKRSRLSANDSRLDLSNGSDQTEECFGNGALVRPKAQKATSYAEMPSGLLDKRESTSIVNSGSKQSKQSHINQAGAQNVHTWLAQTPRNPPDPRNDDLRADKTGFASKETASLLGNSVSDVMDNCASDFTARDHDLAQSHYKGPA